LAKIALELSNAIARRRREGTPGQAASRTIARGKGWSVDDVLCTSGPQDRTFEERHSQYSLAIVLAGTFQYRSTAGQALMTPGSLLLGNAGECFECGHQHATGDRCLAFHFHPEYFERLAVDAEVRRPERGFRRNRLHPVPQLSAPIARAHSALSADRDSSTLWEELAMELATQALQIEDGESITRDLPVGATARVTRVLRRMEHDGMSSLTLTDLAKEARLSPYHFLRTFEVLTGVTPHQYLLRTRLREAALRLTTESAKVLDVAFDCGFGDISNFNRTFRREFGVSPRQWRRAI
jgi:AraC family transcriptional regulator